MCEYMYMILCGPQSTKPTHTARDARIRPPSSAGGFFSPFLPRAAPRVVKAVGGTFFFFGRLRRKKKGHSSTFNKQGLPLFSFAFRVYCSNQVGLSLYTMAAARQAGATNLTQGSENFGYSAARLRRIVKLQFGIVNPNEMVCLFLFILFCYVPIDFSYFGKSFLRK